MNAYDYILNMQDNASGPILAVAQSVGITINQVTVLNNSFQQIENSVRDLGEEIKETNSIMDFLESGLNTVKDKIKGAFSLDSIIEFGKEVFNARVAYEKLNGIKGGVSDEFEKLKAAQGEFAAAWNTFLVSLGGDTANSFKGFISILEKGLSFLTQQLPIISMAFSVLWTFVEPVVTVIRDLSMGLLDLIIGITESKSAMIMVGGILLALGVNFLLANIQAYAFSAALGILEGVIWLVEAASAAWNFVLNMNPISFVIIGIAALIAIIYALWNRFESVRGTIMGVWEVMKGFGTMIKNYVINRFHELLSGITGIGQALLAFFSGDFKKAWEIGKKAATDLMGVNSKKQLLEDGINAGKSYGVGYEKGVKMTTASKVAGKSEIAQKNPQSQAKIQQKTLLGETNLSIINNRTAKTQKAVKASNSGTTDSIVSGGSKSTNIIINIQKLQDDTKIYVESSEKGISNMGEKVQEMLLRAVNSVNQMQTAG
ncbi:hypothetical protein [Flavobacterium panacagri]|uniref:hypothetical protein n=1 Tax=Flavobacterium panacagri TaxID=3034146 RepID=UPI0025A5684D|nr:hypothetical protein [Flavobacterium panacagri]